MWKKINLSVLTTEILLTLPATFSGKIAFGYGLGDLFFYCLMYFILITHLILTLRWNKQPDKQRIMATVFFLLTI